MNPVVEALIEQFITAGLDYRAAQQLASRVERRQRKARAWAALAERDKDKAADRDAAADRLTVTVQDMLRKHEKLANATVSIQPDKPEVIEIKLPVVAPTEPVEPAEPVKEGIKR